MPCWQYLSVSICSKILYCNSMLMICMDRYLPVRHLTVYLIVFKIMFILPVLTYVFICTSYLSFYIYYFELYWFYLFWFEAKLHFVIWTPLSQDNKISSTDKLMWNIYLLPLSVCLFTLTSCPLLWLPQPDFLRFLVFYILLSFLSLFFAAFHICNWDQRLITFHTSSSYRPP